MFFGGGRERDYLFLLVSFILVFSLLGFGVLFST